MQYITNKLLKLLAILIIMLISSTDANAVSAIDSFDDEVNNDRGLPRQHMNDSMTGGNTTTSHFFKSGVMHIKGDIEPPRGQPGWASTVLLLSPDGTPINADKYQGIRVKLRINRGMVSLSANSTEVTNFDYHAALLSAPIDGNFHEINIPFDSMKRAWSEQTKLNTQTINSLSIVAFSMQKASFDFQIDEIAFY